MRRQSFTTVGIVLVAVSGALAKKEPAIPTTATKPKQVALVRVNVTGQGHDYFRPWQKKAPFSKTSTELPATAVLSVRPASEGISSSIGELHSMCSLGSR